MILLSKLHCYKPAAIVTQYSVTTAAAWYARVPSTISPNVSHFPFKSSPLQFLIAQGAFVRLTGVLDARGRSLTTLMSYVAAKSNRRFLVNSSAASASLRQRAACSLKNELSITRP